MCGPPPRVESAEPVFRLDLGPDDGPAGRVRASVVSAGRSPLGAARTNYPPTLAGVPGWIYVCPRDDASEMGSDAALEKRPAGMRAGDGSLRGDYVSLGWRGLRRRAGMVFCMEYFSLAFGGWCQANGSRRN